MPKSCQKLLKNFATVGGNNGKAHSTDNILKKKTLIDFQDVRVIDKGYFSLPKTLESYGTFLQLMIQITTPSITWEILD